jgi:JmjC domain, hydroxylase
MTPAPPLLVPEFRPSAAEFADFGAFVARIERLCPAGAAIVRPPRGWRPRKNIGYDDIDDLVVRRPIRQEVLGSKGVFVAMHIVQPKRTVKEFREEAAKFARRCCAPSLEFPPEDMTHSSPLTPCIGTLDSTRPQHTAHPASPAHENQAHDQTDKQINKSCLDPHQSPQPPNPPPGEPGNSVLSSGLAEWKGQSSTLQSLVQTPSDGGDVMGHPALKGPTPTEESLAKLDTVFWKNIIFRRPMYGADLQGTLFEDDVCEAWNLNHLDTILDLFPAMTGVNDPYLYIGMFGSLFCFHVEDADLYGINYLHLGAPKTWYTIPVSHRARFEALCQRLYPSHFDACKEFMRHKQGLISLDVLQKHGIPFGRVTQLEGTFTVVFPGVYHAGFNHGFNVAEAINFASLRWLHVARNVSACTCRKDTVRLDVDAVDRILFPGKYTEEFARKRDQIARTIEQIRSAKRMRGQPGQTDYLTATELARGQSNMLVRHQPADSEPSQCNGKESTANMQNDAADAERANFHSEGMSAIGLVESPTKMRSETADVAVAGKVVIAAVEPLTKTQPSASRTDDVQVQPPGDANGATPKRRRTWAPIPLRKMADVAIRSGSDDATREAARIARATMCGIEIQLLTVSTLLNTTSAILRDVVDTRRVASLGKRMSRTRHKYMAVQAGMFEPCAPGMGHLDNAPRFNTAQDGKNRVEFVENIVNCILKRAMSCSKVKPSAWSPRDRAEPPSCAVISHVPSEPPGDVPGPTLKNADHNNIFPSVTERIDDVQLQRLASVPPPESTSVPSPGSTSVPPPGSNHELFPGETLGDQRLNWKAYSRSDDGLTPQIASPAAVNISTSWVNREILSTHTSSRGDGDNIFRDVNEPLEWACADVQCQANGVGRLHDMPQMTLLADEDSIESSDEFAQVTRELIAERHLFCEENGSRPR